ncbi:hypothetical protein ACWCQK_23410 [Streptomyces sp. NPDC002306]
MSVQVAWKTRDRMVVAVGEARSDNRNNIIVFRETLSNTLPNHPRASGDDSYRRSSQIRTPRRGPAGRIIKDRNHPRFHKR